MFSMFADRCSSILLPGACFLLQSVTGTVRPLRMKRLACIGALLVVNSVLWADWPTGQVTKHAYLEVIIANRTSQNVNETEVYFGTNACTAGIVGAGASAGYLGWTRPVTTNATVRWVDVHSLKREQTVSLVEAYNPRFAGALTFIIGTTNVSVQFKRIDRR